MSASSIDQSSGIPSRAKAAPTKAFFVKMLTRDISLDDAILDLADNCIDGILRQNQFLGKKSFEGYYIRINIKEDEFVIEDNCGGIPIQVARNYAFKFGREDNDNRDLAIESIGVYGIGMKRAVLKMGLTSIVRSKNAGTNYEVIINEKWILDPQWNDLEIANTNRDDLLKEDGTKIIVKDLYEGCKLQFKNDTFKEELASDLEVHFTSYINRGLKVFFNDKEIKPITIKILYEPGDNPLKPYIYRKNYPYADGDITLSIVVGLHSAKLLDEYDINYEHEDYRPSRISGWSIFCNDRAIIIGDKSKLTGWGERPIPMYHPQYAALSGIVEFRTKDAKKLPVTSTKRSLDASATIWFDAREKMRLAIRTWISYTNNWKNLKYTEQKDIWRYSKHLEFSEVFEQAQKDFNKSYADDIDINPSKIFGGLPKPENAKPSARRIAFSREINEIRYLASSLFDQEDAKPSSVGEACFEEALAKYGFNSEK